MSADYTYEQVMQALRNADAAGDADAARRLAAMAQRMSQQAPAEYPSAVKFMANLAGQPLPNRNEEQMNEFIAGLGGATAGAFAPRAIEAFSKSVKPTAPSAPPQVSSVAPQAAQAVPSAQPAASPKGQAVENWANTQHQVGHMGGNDYADAHQRALNVAQSEKLHPGMKGLPGSGILAPEKDVAEIAQQRAAEQAVLERQQAKAARKALPLSQKIPSPIRSTVGGIGGVIEEGLPRRVSGIGFGFNAGNQGVEAYNRAMSGDVPGAAVSGLGAAGSLMTFLPGRYKKGVGALATGASHLLDSGLNYLRKDREEEPEQKAAGGAIQGYNKGKTVELIGRGVEGGLDLAKKIFTPKPTKIVKASEALGPHENKYLGLTQTDNFGVHEGRMGGNQFPNFQNISPLHAKDRIIWMNDSQKHANDLVKNRRMNDRDVIFSTYIGAPDQLKSNKTVTSDVLSNFYSQNWTPEQIEAINRNIATRTKGKDKGLVFTQPFDIRDKFAVQELGMDTFDRRGALAELLGMGSGVGGRKAGFGLKNYEDILKSHRDPLTEGVPTSSVGTRLFSVDETPARFSTEYHPDYNWAVQGQDMGVQFNPVPQNLIVPDWYKRTEAKSPGKNRTHGNAWFSYMKEPQLITHDYLMGLEKAGYKEGGLAALEN